MKKFSKTDEATKKFLRGVKPSDFDFSKAKVRHNGIVMSKFDIAWTLSFDLNYMCIPWTQIYYVHSYSELRNYLIDALIELDDYER